MLGFTACLQKSLWKMNHGWVQEGWRSALERKALQSLLQVKVMFLPEMLEMGKAHLPFRLFFVSVCSTWQLHSFHGMDVMNKGWILKESCCSFVNTAKALPSSSLISYAFHFSPGDCWLNTSEATKLWLLLIYMGRVRSFLPCCNFIFIKHNYNFYSSESSFLWWNLLPSGCNDGLAMQWTTSVSIPRCNTYPYVET